MASLGAKVLQTRSVEMAMTNQVPAAGALEFRSAQRAVRDQFAWLRPRDTRMR